jgi:hypothetical protein
LIAAGLQEREDLGLAGQRRLALGLAQVDESARR